MHSLYCFPGANELSIADKRFMSKLYKCCVFLYTRHQQTGFDHILTCVNRFRTKKANEGQKLSLEAAFLRLKWPQDLKDSMKNYSYLYIPF